MEGFKPAESKNESKEWLLRHARIVVLAGSTAVATFAGHEKANAQSVADLLADTQAVENISIQDVQERGPAAENLIREAFERSRGQFGGGEAVQELVNGIVESNPMYPSTEDSSLQDSLMESDPLGEVNSLKMEADSLRLTVEELREKVEEIEQKKIIGILGDPQNIRDQYEDAERRLAEIESLLKQKN